VTPLPAPAFPRVETRLATAVLIALAALAPLSIDMFLPSMPQMARDFETSTGTVSLAVTLFIFSFAASQLVYGPASDRFGRRPALLSGLALFIVGGALCLFANSVEWLIAGRILQGLGGGAGPAIANAVVVDVYKRERAHGILAIMTVSIALAPMLAPIAGGFLHEVWGWRSVFVVLAGIGVLLALAFAALIPETNTYRDANALNARGMASNYANLFRSRVYVTFALVMALLFSGQLIFISTSSFVLVDDLGVSETTFGFSFGFVAAGIMLGATISRRLAGKWPSRRIVLTAATFGFAAAVVMASLAAAGVAHLVAIVVPMFILAAGNGMARPAATAAALTEFPRTAGLAAAVLGFSQMAIASAYSVGFNFFLEPGPKTMTAAIAISSFAALALLLAAPPRPVMALAEQVTP
jgi:MFS transporter, DHA1 family, multidrug resistance protein